MPHEFHFQNLEQSLTKILESCLKDLGIAQSIPVIIEIPKESSQGDLSSNLPFRIASILKKKPRDCAQAIVSVLEAKLKKSKIKELISDIKIAGPGFINFYLSGDFLYGMIRQICIDKESFAKLNIGKGKKVQIEFVSANPTGPLSVAHARQAAVGDSLANVLDTLGFKVTREYYNNDEGNQINILGKSVELRFNELVGQKVEFPEDCYQGDYIIDLAKEIAERKINTDTPESFREFALEKMTQTIKDELKDFGVKFDVWYSQKDLRESGKIEKAIAFLKKKGFIYEQEGAVWFKSTAFEDDKDRVIIKSDKAYTYLAPDIAYHSDKYKRGFDWVINLWGPDHHGYVPRIKAAVQALGHDKDSLSVIIVQLATIFREGKPVSMSTRKGQYITLREVLDEVGRDAARFFLLMRRTDSHLEFDLELAKKHTPENPVFYVQYAHARICNILKNAQDLKKLNLKKIDLSVLKENEERQLLRCIFEFIYFLKVCMRQLDVYAIGNYLQYAAGCFHRFYDKHRVISDDKQLTEARLVLIEALRIVFVKGLDLLGVSKPEKM